MRFTNWEKAQGMQESEKTGKSATEISRNIHKDGRLLHLPF